MSSEMETLHLERSYWVVPGKLFAGCYPGSEEKEEAGRIHRAMLGQGICHVVNLMEPDETNWSGRPFVGYEDPMKDAARTMGRDITFQRFPIKDMSAPPRIVMCRILDNIDENVEKGKPVYVHCWGGIGRTGTVVGCYLARHGIADGENILAMIGDLRRHTANHRVTSPETVEQFDMILSWVEGE